MGGELPETGSGDDARSREAAPTSLRARLHPVGDGPTDAERAREQRIAESHAGPVAPIQEHERQAVLHARVRNLRRNAVRSASRARRTSLALLFFPVFFIYLIVDGFRELNDRISRARQIERQRTPPFRRPAQMPDAGERSMADIVATIEAYPFQPLPLPAQISFMRDNGADALGALLSPNPQISTIPHLYPIPFSQQLFSGADGAQLAGMRAMHEHRGPAIVICHGLQMTKNFDLIIQMARRAFEDWGFHVVTIDLRSWGQSAWTSDAPSSAGFLEGQDIVEIARTLHEDPLVTSVGVIGFSLGGASALNAARFSSEAEDHPIDGGTIAVSAPSDIDSALRYISTRPPFRSPFFGLYQLFCATIKATVRRQGLSRDIRTWHDMVGAVSAPYYEMDMGEFCERASATTFAHTITQPVLEIHSEDDFVVPVQHAELLKQATIDNPWVHVMVRSRGAHVSFGAVDARWFNSTVRRFLEYWATQGDVAQVADDPEIADYDLA